MFRDAFLKNPFYPVVVLAGAAFGITAFASSLLAAREMQAKAATAPSPLTRFLQTEGTRLMMWELGVLAAGTAGAMTTDPYWQRRAHRKSRPGEGPPS